MAGYGLEALIFVVKCDGVLDLDLLGLFTQGGPLRGDGVPTVGAVAAFGASVFGANEAVQVGFVGFELREVGNVLLGVLEAMTWVLTGVGLGGCIDAGG